MISTTAAASGIPTVCDRPRSPRCARAGPLGHEPVHGRRDVLVHAEQEPGRDGLPGPFAGFLVQRRLEDRALVGGHGGGHLCGRVGRELAVVRA